MQTLWFAIVAILIAGYVILDGFDIGCGAIHLLVARTDSERRQALAAIGPFWDGNEVWLIAGGGTLYFAFPALYASGFSGFYLPLTIVLWLLILRGISVEFRSHVDTPIWGAFWDVVFCGSSLLLAVFFGAALGNVVRGVPLDKAGDFFLPLWTNFAPGSNPGILDWYTVLCAITAVLALMLHGALWIAYKTRGPVLARAEALAARMWIAVLLAAVALSVASFFVQPLLAQSFAARPWLIVFPLLGAASLILIRVRRAATQRFLASCVFLTGMLTSAAAGIYPYVLPSVSAEHTGLTIYNASPAEYGLAVGLIWWIPAFALAVAYVVFLYRRFAGPVEQDA